MISNIYFSWHANCFDSLADLSFAGGQKEF